MMKPVTAAIAAALISGVAMYTLGAHTATVDAFTQPAVQTLDAGTVRSGDGAQAIQPARYVSRPASVTTHRVAPQRTVSSAAASGNTQRVVSDDARPQRSWTKTAMIIGGSTAGAAGLGGIIDGKKGALIGAALGGGAASIYEASHR